MALVLTRKLDQYVYLIDAETDKVIAVIRVAGIEGSHRVRLAVDAAQDITVLRGELVSLDQRVGV